MFTIIQITLLVLLLCFCLTLLDGRRPSLPINIFNHNKRIHLHCSSFTAISSSSNTIDNVSDSIPSMSKFSYDIEETSSQDENFYVSNAKNYKNEHLNSFIEEIKTLRGTPELVDR